jgi:hypothetical protein
VADTQAEVDVGPLPIVVGDAGQLRRVLPNLLANAVTFVRPGVVPRVALTARRLDSGWAVSVTDNGIGVEPEDVERIFRMFQRGRPGNGYPGTGIGVEPEDVERIFRMFQRGRPGNGYPGTGIGLAVCRRIITRHGGDIRVEPTAAGGSVFTFTLPDRELTLANRKPAAVSGRPLADRPPVDLLMGAERPGSDRSERKDRLFGLTDERQQVVGESDSRRRGETSAGRPDGHSAERQRLLAGDPEHLRHDHGDADRAGVHVGLQNDRQQRSERRVESGDLLSEERPLPFGPQVLEFSTRLVRGQGAGRSAERT